MVGQIPPLAFGLVGGGLYCLMRGFIRTRWADNLYHRGFRMTARLEYRDGETYVWLATLCMLITVWLMFPILSK